MGPRVVTRGNHISTRKGPKKVASSEIATNKRTTKRESITPLRREHKKQAKARSHTKRANRENERSERTAKRAREPSGAPRFI
jgi:hypothetical protein